MYDETDFCTYSHSEFIHGCEFFRPCYGLYQKDTRELLKVYMESPTEDILKDFIPAYLIQQAEEFLSTRGLTVILFKGQSYFSKYTIVVNDDRRGTRYELTNSFASTSAHLPTYVNTKKFAIHELLNIVINQERSNGESPDNWWGYLAENGHVIVKKHFPGSSDRAAASESPYVTAVSAIYQGTKSEAFDLITAEFDKRISLFNNKVSLANNNTP